MTGCRLCGSMEVYPEKVTKHVVDSRSELDPGDSDMELCGGVLSVSVVDGPRQYVAYFDARCCPMCGREL